MTPPKQLMLDLEQEMEWFSAFTKALQKAVAGEGDWPSLAQFPPPALKTDSAYAALATRHRLSAQERFAFVLALIPHLRPELLDEVMQNLQAAAVPAVIGGRRGKYHNGFLPTVQTFLFMLGGADLSKRAELLLLLREDATLPGIGLTIEKLENNEPLPNARIDIEPCLLRHLLTGERLSLLNGQGFPAQAASTEKEWSDLLLTDTQAALIETIFSWMRHREQIVREWKMSRTYGKGFKALFHGLPGTGKTFAATLIGKKLGKTVYRIDLSRILSRFIGETEKNISRLLQMARQDDSILLFDEADALFAKRTGVHNAHDRYANQEVAYLLQAIDDFEGLVILTSNLPDNIDKAFARRLQLIVRFQHLTDELRETLWRRSFPAQVPLDGSIDWPKIAKHYHLTPDQVEEGARHALLRLLEKKTPGMSQELLLEGIEASYAARGEAAPRWW